MLTFAPHPIGDELIYSYMCRWFQLSGDYNRGDFMERAVGVDCRLLTPDVYGIFDVSTCFKLVLDRTEILMRHTLFPFYSQFLDQGLVDNILLSCWDGTSNFPRHWIDQSELTPKSLRFCMECVTEQLRSEGCSIWKRAHNLPHVRACYIHEVELTAIANAAVGVGPERFILPELEDVPTVKAEYADIRLARLAVEVMHEGMSTDRYFQAVKRSLANKKALPATSVREVRKQLHADLLAFKDFGAVGELL